MATPQLENGYLSISIELAEALTKVNLSAYESRILWALIRKTYGWHKKFDVISRSQFASSTGISERHVSRTLNSLINRKFIIKHRVGKQSISYALQKNYELWR